MIRATILGCGSSGGVPRIGGHWGACDPAEPKNRRRRCALLVERIGAEGRTQVLIDTGHLAHETPRNPATGEEEDDDVGFPGHDHHIAEQSPPMKIAMAVLAFLAIFAGFVQVPGLDETITHFLDPVFADSPLAAIQPSTGASWFGLLIGGAISLAGIGIAYWAYVLRPDVPGKLIERFGWLHTFLYNKWYFDELIDIAVVRPALAIGRFANSTFERFIVDGVVNGTRGTVGGAGEVVRSVQNGFVRSYALTMLAGIVAILGTVWVIQ